jgi:hypothetical protein
MRLVTIDLVEHTEQRYDTVGDWEVTPGNTLKISVSHLGNHNMQVLVAVHELVEAILCFHRGVLPADVDKFDINFDGKGEPGDDPQAPYHREHVFATQVEQMLAQELGVDWDVYERRIDALP